QAPRRGPGAPRALSSRDRCWAADPGALARPLPRRRLRRTGDSLTSGHRLPPSSARPRPPDRGPGTEQAAAGHHHHPPQSHRHLRRPEMAGPLLLGGVGHRADPGSRHGHPRPEGAASYRDKHELVLRRQAELPNAMWQSDDTMFDILVVGTDGKPARPWLTTILDDCSRAVCGYTVFLGAPSAMDAALALRQAIWHKTDPAWPMCGLPDVLYVDHGSDFTSDQLAHT